MAAIARIGVLAAVVLGLTAFGAQTGSSHALVAVPPTQVHGINALIKSQLDTNFCVNVGNGGAEGRTITLANCGPAATELFAFTDYADDTNTIVENQGMCLDGGFRKAHPDLALQVRRCGGGRVWHWSFTSAGLIENAKTGTCLGVAGAVGGAAVHPVACDETNAADRWTLGKGA
jgi:hypothetical protein